MKKVYISSLIVLLGVAALGYYLFRSDQAAVTEFPDQFSWDVTIDTSACDSHLCGTDLVLDFNQQQFSINDYLGGKKLGGCNLDMSYGELEKDFAYSNLPDVGDLVTYKICPVMGGGSLFYVLKTEVGYQVMEKIFSDSDYAEGPTDSSVLFEIQ